jgi:Ca2+-binding EF-hand superfamily protein
MTVKTALLTITALSLLSPAFADHRESEAKWLPRFRGMDRNADGAISSGEWRGNRRTFNNHDWNRDGLIAGEELTRESRFGSADRVDNSSNQRDSRFQSMDRNGDGMIQSHEWTGESQVFHLLDRDFNSRLSYEEFTDRDRNLFMRDMDRNGDGVIGRNEWRGNRAAFRDLDFNGNGVLDNEEFLYRGDRQSRKTRFSHIDTNNNGVIDGNEWHGNRQAFHTMDTNRNSVLDYDEYVNNQRFDQQGTADRMEEDEDSYFNWRRR